MSRFVVVEGLIGVGKTSLCRLLQRTWGARLVLEPAETNPFLTLFYQDPRRYALPVQVHYLLARWRQQEQIAQGDLFSELVVADYLFEKDRLFAEKTLDEEELAIYDRLAGALGGLSPTPDLVVFLDAPTPDILRRIAGRGVAGEDQIGADYLDDLRERYLRLLGSWRRCPVLMLDNTRLNYTRDSPAQDEVLERIRAAMAYGRSAAPGSVLDREDQPSLFGAGPLSPE